MGAKITTTTKLEQMPNCPTALGLAAFDMATVVFPEVAFDSVSGGVKFHAATSDYEPSIPTVLLLGEGSFTAGMGTIRVGPAKPEIYTYDSAHGARRSVHVMVSRGGKNEWLGTTPKIGTNGVFSAVLKMDRETCLAVREKEEEHLADFKYAYELTAQTMAEAINGLTSTVFVSADAAMRELLKKLDPRLAPEYPLDLASWKPHLLDIANALADLSIERDTVTREHCPEGYDVQLSWNAKPTPTLTYEPRLKALSTATNLLIRLDKLPPAKWDGTTLRAATMKTLSVGMSTKVKVETPGVLIHRQKGPSNWDFDGSHDRILAGLPCTVEEVLSDGIWVSVTKAQCQVCSGMVKPFEDYYGSYGNATKVWFKLPADKFG